MNDEEVLKKWKSDRMASFELIAPTDFEILKILKQVRSIQREQDAKIAELYKHKTIITADLIGMARHNGLRDGAIEIAKLIRGEDKLTFKGVEIEFDPE